MEIQLLDPLPLRAQAAVLHTLAAAIELSTPDGERWALRLEPFDAELGLGRICLELYGGTEAETARAMAVLRDTVGLAKRFSR